MPFIRSPSYSSLPQLDEVGLPTPHRIAIVSETWPPEINGVSFSMLQLAKGLQQRGHMILLIRPQQKMGAMQYDFVPDEECLV